ncbi:MAG: cold shock domain-containing protein [Candidatus Thermoplasmatota archaeon]
MEGVVKKWINKKGYGFIGVDGQEDVFVHHSDVKKEGFVVLREGQKVKFELVNTNKGKRAKNVELVE